MNSRRSFDVYPVNPKYKYLGTTPCWARLSELPIKVDLVVIAIPSEKVLNILKECAQLGITNILVTPGNEFYTSDCVWRDCIASFIKAHNMRLIGPDSTGIMRTDIGLNVSYIPELPRQGYVGFIAQSSSIATSVLDYSKTALFGFSSVITSGAETDIQITDILKFLADDSETSIIGIHMESMPDARSFYLALRETAKKKPVVVFKASSELPSQKLIASRLAKPTGDDSLFDALLRRVGAIRCHELEEFCTTLEILSAKKPIKQSHLSVLANGLGYATLIADAMHKQGIPVSEPSRQTIDGIQTIVPSAAPETNPVDLGMEATAERYIRVLSAFEKDPDTNAILLAVAPTPTIDLRLLAEKLKPIVQSSPKLIFAVLVQRIPSQDILLGFQLARIPTFLSIPSAISAFRQLCLYEKLQSLRTTLSSSGYESAKPNLTTAQNIIDDARCEKRLSLTEMQSIELLKTFGINSAKSLFAGSLSDAQSVASRINFPVALKLCADGIKHKSDFNGVVLNCRNNTEVANAYAAIERNCRIRAPMARFRGVLVQQMAKMPNARSLSISVIRDPLYGPGIMLGAGGLTGEIFSVKATALLPLTEPLARDLIAQSCIATALEPFRGLPKANIDALVHTLLNVSRIITELPAVSELSINPLFIDDNTVQAIDCSVTLNSSQGKADKEYSHLVVTSAPSSVDYSFDTDAGQLRLRSIRSDDYEPLREFVTNTQGRASVLLNNPDPNGESLNIEDVISLDYIRKTGYLVCDNNRHQPTIYAVAVLTLMDDSSVASFNLAVRPGYESDGLEDRLLGVIEEECKGKRSALIHGHISSDSKSTAEALTRFGYRSSNVKTENNLNVFVKVLGE